MADKKDQDWQIKQKRENEFKLYHHQPFVSRNDKITFVTEYHRSSPYYGGICQYDEKEDKIKIISKFPESMQLTNFSYCYAPNTDQIFINDIFGDIIIYNMETQKWQKLDKALKRIGGLACCILSNNHMHIFGGSVNNNHIIYDIKNKTYKTGVSLPHKYKDSKAIQVSNNKILVIGGRYQNESYDWMYSDIVYEILLNEDTDDSSITNKYQMPQSLMGMGCIKRESYIYIFGGHRGDIHCNTIYSFNIISHKWAKSSLTTPSAAEYHAVLLNDEMHLFKTAGTEHYVIKFDVLLNHQFSIHLILIRHIFDIYY